MAHGKNHICYTTGTTTRSGAAGPAGYQFVPVVSKRPNTITSWGEEDGEEVGRETERAVRTKSPGGN